MIALVYGGSGSGKSAFAEDLVMKLDSKEKYYIATMQIYGKEGMEKVERHRRLRAGKGFETVESPRNLKDNVDKFLGEKEVVDSTALLECMSNLLANEYFSEEVEALEAVEVKKMAETKEKPESMEVPEAKRKPESMEVPEAKRKLESKEVYGNRICEKIVSEVKYLSTRVSNLVIVTNNVFEDGINYDASTLEYMRVLGQINCKLASMADQVYEVVVGIPIAMKEDGANPMNKEK